MGHPIYNANIGIGYKINPWRIGQGNIVTNGQYKNTKLFADRTNLGNPYSNFNNNLIR